MENISLNGNQHKITTIDDDMWEDIRLIMKKHNEKRIEISDPVTIESVYNLLMYGEIRDINDIRYIQYVILRSLWTNKYKKFERYCLMEMEIQGNGDRIFDTGRRLITNGKYDRALWYLLMAMQHETTKVRALQELRYLGQTYMDSLNYEQARQCYLILAKHNVLELDDLVMLEIIHRKLGNLDEAKVWRNRILDSNYTVDNVVSIYEELGEEPCEESDRERISIDDGAINFCIAAMERGNMDAVSELGDIYRLKGEFDLSKKYYELALQHNNTRAMIGSAYLYAPGSEETYRKYMLMTIEHGDTGAMFRLGEHYIELSQIDEAWKYFMMGANVYDTSCIQKLNSIISRSGSFARMIDAYDYLDKSNRAKLNDTLAQILPHQDKVCKKFLCVWCSSDDNEPIPTLIIHCGHNLCFRCYDEHKGSCRLCSGA